MFMEINIKAMSLPLLPWLLSLPIGSLYFTGNGEFFELPIKAGFNEHQ